MGELRLLLVVGFAPAGRVPSHEEEIARLRAEGTGAGAVREQNGSKMAELGAGGHAP